MERSEVVVLGRDNAILRQIFENDDPLALDQVTRITVTLSPSNAEASAVTVDSANTSGVITWSGAIVTLRLGGQALPVGRYRAALRLFSPAWPAGVVLSAFPAEVRQP